MKRFALGLALVGIVALGTPATAVIGTIDAVPAATLLLPYFEVDLTSDQGVTTLFSINNASQSAAVAHVVVWSNTSVPIIDFDVYLTGYDVQTINMRDIVKYGILPRTADRPADPNDKISPQGPFSEDINYPGSSGPCIAPYNNPVLTGAYLDYIQKALLGLPVASPAAPGTIRCWGQPFGDQIARGYVTIDFVNECSLLMPDTPIYYDRVIGYENILWGDYFYVEPGNDFATGETLVHIEAGDAQQFNQDDYSFYGRYQTPPWSGFDRREGLASSFATRFIEGGAFTGGTELIVWRDSRAKIVDRAPVAGRCDFYGVVFPLNEVEWMYFDEAEQAEEICTPDTPDPVISPPPPGSADPACLPLEAGRYKLVDEREAPWDFGWIYLNLNLPPATIGGDVLPAQAWVSVVMRAEGRYAVGYEAIQLDNVYSNWQNFQFTPLEGGGE